MPESRISHLQFGFEDGGATPFERDIARAYWSIEGNGAWTYKAAELGPLFDLPLGISAISLIRNVITVTIPGLCCPCCKTPLPLQDRTKFAPILRKLIAGRDLQEAATPCGPCEQELARKERETQAEQERARKAPVREAILARQRPIDYATISARHALLLGGLVYGTGGNYITRRIPSWHSAGKPPLCRDMNDLFDVYRELYSVGLISPDPDGPLHAVSLTDDGYNFYLDQVGYVIAQPDDGVIGNIKDRLAEALNPDSDESVYSARDFREWIHLGELKHYFLQLHDRFGYRSDGVTDKILESLKEVINEFSLGQSMRIVFLSMNRLASKVSDKTYHPRHVANMIPGSFQRTIDVYQSNGWPIEPYDIKPDCAIYTQYLYGVLQTAEDYANREEPILRTEKQHG